MTIRDEAWKRQFSRFWMSQTVVQIVTQSIAVTVPLIAITYLATPSNQIGLISALQYLPVLIVTPLLGAYVDGVRRRPLMLLAHCARAVIYGAATVIFLLGGMTSNLLLALVLIAGAFTAAFDVALQTFVPNTVPTTELIYANSRIQGSLSFAQVMGPSLGAILIAIGAPWPVTALFAMGFAAAALLLLRNRAVESVTRADPTQSFRSRFTAGFRVAMRSRVLWTLLISSTWFNLFEQASIATFLVFAVRSVGLESSLVAFVLGAGAAGAVVGALVSNRIASRSDRPVLRLLVYSGMAAITPIALNILPGLETLTLAVAIAIFAVYGFGLTAYNVEAISMRQRNMPVGAQGKTGAAYRMFAYGALAIGGLLSSGLVTIFGLQLAMLIATACLVVGWVLLIPVYVRGLGDAT